MGISEERRIDVNSWNVIVKREWEWKTMNYPVFMRELRNKGYENIPFWMGSQGATKSFPAIW